MSISIARCSRRHGPPHPGRCDRQRGKREGNETDKYGAQALHRARIIGLSRLRSSELTVSRNSASETSPQRFYQHRLSRIVGTTCG